MGMIAVLTGSEVFRSPENLAMAIRLALADLVDDLTIQAGPERGHGESEWPDRDSNHFEARSDGGCDRWFKVRVMESDSPSDEVMQLARRIGYEETAAALRVLAARGKEQREARDATRHEEARTGTPATVSDDDDEEDEEFDAEVA
jgi:hypothetical protein